MSPTIALVCLWYASQPPTPSSYDIGWAATTSLPTAVWYLGYAPIHGAVCPIHGPLSHGTWGEALTFAGSDNCRTRPVCIRCLIAAIEAPDSCIPKVEVLE